MTGWWFQSFFHFIYGIILPIDELIFVKMVIAPRTSDVMGYRDLVEDNGTYSDTSGFQWHMICRYLSVHGTYGNGFNPIIPEGDEHLPSGKLT